MSNKSLTIGLLISIVLAIGGYFFPGQMAHLAGAIKDTSYFDYFNAATGGGFQINGTNVLNATTLKTTTAGGTLTVTTSNAATSTASLGCVQTVATSTATPIRLLFTASTTATAISGTQAGFVLWGYGTCPF